MAVVVDSSNLAYFVVGTNLSDFASDNLPMGFERFNFTEGWNTLSEIHCYLYSGRCLSRL